MRSQTPPRRRGRIVLALAASLLVAAPAAAEAATPVPVLPDIRGIAPVTAAEPCGGPAIATCAGLPTGMPRIPALGLDRRRNHTLVDGNQIPIAATGVYGQGGSNGAAVSCFVGVATGTPGFYRGDTRYISYSGSVFCPAGNARNIVTMHITEVSLKDAVTGGHLASAPGYGPYVIANDGGTTGGNYTRPNDTQLQFIKIQAYLEITSGQSGSSTGWHVIPPQCTKLSRFKVRCDFNSGAFGFVPSNAPAADNVQAVIDAAIAAGDAHADSAIDTLVGVGEPFTNIIGGVVDPHIIGVNNQIQALAYGAPWGAAWRVVKCAAAIAGFVAGNLILISKIRKLGGFVKVAKRIVGAKDKEAALKAILGGAVAITGAGGVVTACGG